jgi:glutamate-ammonia-ligase adenylyltransferase
MGTPYLISERMDPLNVKDLLLAPQLDRGTVAQLLQPYGFKDVVRADANLQTSAAEPSERELLAAILQDVLACASNSADPDQALAYLERFARSGINKPQLFSYLRGSPQALEILIRSLGGSSYMAEILIRNPQLFYWVCDPQILGRARRKREIQRDLLGTIRVLPAEQQRLDYLRFIKRREMLHIGVRDLLRIATVQETWTSLSVLAEALVSCAHAICESALRSELGLRGPAFKQFTILAMGKLGGGELNFSSDVDLMYLYGKSEEAAGLSASEYFRRLSQKITQGLNNLTGEGYVYRVDLRLRPEGKAGNIAESLDGFRRYYQTRLAAWERLALLKAWPIAGSWRLGTEFLQMAETFVYGGPFDEDSLRNILDIKRKIDEKAANQKRGGRNVKLGPGGIREIELIAQSLQVCYGNRLPELRERNTSRALDVLRTKALLSDEEYDSLSKAYVFLRDVENKLQMVQDTQTHWLPSTAEELSACANLLGYRRGGVGSPVEEFERDYLRHTTEVNRIFEDVLGKSSMARFSPLP